MQQYNPIIIGGTGGSGTRIVRSILQRAGVFMGQNVNDFGDSLRECTDNSINKLLAITKSINYNLVDLPLDFTFDTLKELDQALNLYYRDRPEQSIAWGLKNPRYVYLLPFFTKIYPDCYFVHVVRDGRDMAISENQNQFNDLYKQIFDVKNVNSKVGSAQLWNHVNTNTYNYGKNKLKDNYQIVRYEDLCNKPHETITTMFTKLDFEIENIKPLVDLVKPNTSSGRYKKLEPELLSKISVAAAEGLRLFNYV